MKGAAVGRIVHYVQHIDRRWNRGAVVGTHLAAIITGVRHDPDGVPTGHLGLHVFYDGAGWMDPPWVPYSEDHLPGTWHWPERVE